MKLTVEETKMMHLACMNVNCFNYADSANGYAYCTKCLHGGSVRLPDDIIALKKKVIEATKKGEKIEYADYD